MHRSRQPCFGASGGCGSGEVYAHIKQVVEQKSLTAEVPDCMCPSMSEQPHEVYERSSCTADLMHTSSMHRCCLSVHGQLVAFMGC